MNDRQLMKQANEFNPDWDVMAVMVEEQQRMAQRIEELEAALAQPEQEHSEQWWRHEVSNAWAEGYEKGRLQREWQGLTDEEAFDAFGFNLWPESFLVNVSQELKDTHEEAKKEVLDRVRAIEAKLKEKNHG